MKKTLWNKKLEKFSGIYIRCSEFEKDGRETEGYVINADGSLTFRNELRSLNAASTLVKGQFKNYWNVQQKFNFLKIAQVKLISEA